MSNFITNSIDGKSMQTRLQKLIPVSQELKFLVGFFYFSGWQEIYNYLQSNTEINLKVLVGLSVDKTVSGTLIEVGNFKENQSREEVFSDFIKSLGKALNHSDMDTEIFHDQFDFFIKLIEIGRLEIRKTQKPNHAKIYLFAYNTVKADETEKKGQLITGSSNLTKAGLQGQEEFNVEIKDYGFEEAERYFDERWEIADSITALEEDRNILIEFLKNQTQAALITPFEAYVYILKTYLDLHEIKKVDSYLDRLLLDAGFQNYSYQKDAVGQALHVIEQHNGVIIADVVGLGKSVIASLIAKQLRKRGLILCPPGLMGNAQQKTGWHEYKHLFQLYDWDIESVGKVEEIAETIEDQNYDVIIIDEAHRFRNQDTAMYEALAIICKAKQVILLTATPFNNSPADIFSLLKLFVIPGQSSLSIESNLEQLFKSYDYRFKRLSNILKDYNSENDKKRKRVEKIYKDIFKSKPPINVSLVRNEVKFIATQIKDTIKDVTIRRNRIDLKQDVTYSKEVTNLSEVEDPKEIFYELSEKQSIFYDKVIYTYFGENGQFTGAIYRPSQYENEQKDEEKKSEEENRIFQQQNNLYGFMRRLLVKRFESSFGSFEKSIERFLKVNRMVKSFIEHSDKYILDRKVIEGIYNEQEGEDDFVSEQIENALEEFERNAQDKTSPKHTTIYEVNKFKFKKQFLEDIENDIALFEMIQREIKELDLIQNDPKRKKIVETIKDVLKQSKESNVPKRKVILFTEYTDTVRHLEKYFSAEFAGRVLFCDGSLSKKTQLELNTNFNAKYKDKDGKQEDDFDVLVTSDKLSEGFNLNRAGLIINYDIPWNPTRVIQRVGRINRIGTKVFETLYIYNFFPTLQGATIVKSREIAAQKMFLIHNALGEDAKIFDASEEPSASSLFSKIGKYQEDEEISIDTFVRNEFAAIKENYPEVLERINSFPNRIKTAKFFEEENTLVLRKKGTSIFPLVIDKDKNIERKTFKDIVSLVKCDFETPAQPLSKAFWKNYEEAKNYAPKSRRASPQISLEQQALNSLKTLSKKYREQLNSAQLEFITTLIQDLRKYKTLPTYTLRRLVLANESKKAVKATIESIEEVRRRLGNNYLEIILRQVQNLEEDIIISVENQMKKEDLI
ncbi:helicase-related protein [Bernardetia sp. OM2101]|uniref:helicase-related protein n=1 Tax=Bernardetia sp. OM2101 TaxID=3344876 RepID=UPI0035D05803